MTTLLKAVHTIHHSVGEKAKVTAPGTITHFEDADVAFLKGNGAAVEPTEDELKLHALANPAPAPVAAAPVAPVKPGAVKPAGDGIG